MLEITTYTAFAGARRVAEGPLAEVIPVLKRRFDADPADMVLVFEDETGSQVDFDLRGTPAEALERAVPPASKGPGRPRLGVSGREVSLLPRHWSWLEQQPQGTSAAVRRLVEGAAKAEPGRERARRVRAALSRVLTALAGDRPHYEEACRALFAGDAVRFDEAIARWPRDVREYMARRASEAVRAEEQPVLGRSASAALVVDLHRRVWSAGDMDALESLVAPSYTVHSDPGDPWEGQALDRSGYERRVRFTRDAFPDVAFTVHDIVDATVRVAVRWSAEGTHLGDLPGLPATQRRVTYAGQTIYEIVDGRIAGHWQTVDRLGFWQQVRARDAG